MLISYQIVAYTHIAPPPTTKNNYRQLKRLNTLQTIYRRIIKTVTYNLLNAFWWCLIETRVFFVYHRRVTNY